MTEFIYKVASRGEGKTKWLLEQAKRELDSGEKVVLLTAESRSGIEYRKFHENYFVTFHEVCKVDNVNHLHDIPHDAIVLIDNLLRLDMHINAISNLYGKVKRVYVTLDGKTSVPVVSCEVDPNQLSIFDTMSEGS